MKNLVIIATVFFGLMSATLFVLASFVAVVEVPNNLWHLLTVVGFLFCASAVGYLTAQLYKEINTPIFFI
jgi:hypothetical protein